MRRAQALSRTLEARAGVLAALVLVVVTAGVASAVALEPPAPVPAATPAAAGPRPLTDADLVVVPASEVLPTAVELVLPERAPEPAAPPPVPAPAAAVTSAPAAAPEPGPPADPLCSGDGWQQRRGQAALEQLRRPSDAAAFRLSFEPGRSGVIGLASVGEGRLQVFVRSCGDLSTALLQHVVAHELGHLVDAAGLGEDERAAWLQARGIPAGTPWYGCDACTDFATPAGDFAEVYAQWQTGAGSNRSQLAGSPSSGQLAELAARFF